MENGNSAESAVILSGYHSLHPKPKPRYLVEVTRREVRCTPVAGPDGREPERTKRITLDLDDVVGCDCMKGKIQTDSNGYLAIYSYPVRSKMASKKKVRRREVVTITFSDQDTYDSNIQEANRWKQQLSAILRGTYLNDQGLPQPVSRRSTKRLLVLINPFSGPGKALQIFQERIVPMLAEAGLHFNMVVTERAGHAREIACNMRLEDWNAIVIVSGDGLIFEVLNGLMERPDWEKARMMPIGALPGGSGNALCCTLNYQARESISPYNDMVLNSTFILVKHKVFPMDLVAVDTCQRRIYSFLSITWGIIADVDIESEKYRNLGNARFTVGAAKRIFSLRKYRGRLSFLPIGDYNPRARQAGPHRSPTVTNGFSDDPPPRPTPSPSMIVLPENRSPDKEEGEESAGGSNGFQQDDTNGGQNGHPQSPNDLVRANSYHQRESQSEANMDSNSLQQVAPQQNGDHSQITQRAESGGQVTFGLGPESPESGSCMMENGADSSSERMPQGIEYVQLDVNQLREAARSSQSSEPEPESPHNASPPGGRVPTPLLPPLTEPVPADWVTLEDDFITVAAVYQTHLSSDFLASPSSKLGDGVIYLTYVRAPMSRGAVLRLMLSMEDGSYLQHEGQEMVPVKAFRLEPLENRGTLSVDGEAVEYGPIQAQVLPSMTRVLAK